MKDKIITQNKPKKTIKPVSKGIITFIVLAVLAVALFLVPDFLEKNEQNRISSYSQVSKICELATLKCYYHDVAEEVMQPDGLFQYGLFQYGYKKFWIEYDGIVELGIDAEKVIINEPDSRGCVKIFVPEARVLDVDMDEETMHDIIFETGFLTQITTEDQAAAYSLTQSKMKEKAGSDETLLTEARENAKILLEKYVIEIGNQLGKQYTVSWIEDTSENNSSTESEPLEGE